MGTGQYTIWSNLPNIKKIPAQYFAESIEILSESNQRLINDSHVLRNKFFGL
jgi:hypothetical protein